MDPTIEDDTVHQAETNLVDRERQARQDMAEHLPEEEVDLGGAKPSAQ
jgi:hypothetical protein